uniref:C-type lectin domain-containing protein n=1 Tax=Labrus bergylta TaxID=56723 RepID=A0A3Q3EIS2_9LABR
IIRSALYMDQLVNWLIHTGCTRRSATLTRIMTRGSRACWMPYSPNCSIRTLKKKNSRDSWTGNELKKTLQTDPHSKDTHFNHLYDLPHMHAEHNNRYAKDLIQKAQTQEVWIGLRFLAGNWLWVNGFPLEEQLLVCPKPKMNCGTMSKTGSRLFRDCSERRNFLCSLKNNLN